MSENILVCVAWPYANGSIHLGHVAGAYLPADIFARYHRIKGNNVIMVSGSDAHGTPVTITAENEGVSPEEIADKYQQEFLKDWTVWESSGIFSLPLIQKIISRSLRIFLFDCMKRGLSIKTPCLSLFAKIIIGFWQIDM